MLDAYDHRALSRPKGNEAIYILTYEECMEVIRKMRFGDESDLFGREKDDSFKGSIGNYVSLLPRQKQGPVCDGRKRIEDSTLVALTIMIAESRAEEKEMLVSVVMNCM